MSSRVTTNRDIDRLRALGAAGLLQSEAARKMGWSETRVRFWVRKCQLPFALGQRKEWAVGGRLYGKAPRPVRTPSGWCKSISEAARLYGVAPRTAYYRAYRGIMGWSFADE